MDVQEPAPGRPDLPDGTSAHEHQVAHDETFLQPGSLLWFAIVLSIALVIGRAFLLVDTPMNVLAASDNDDIMRFLSVHDLLAGQSWFDMTQYRMLPPEGLSLHWSRLVDLGIAAMIGLAALVLPIDSALSFTIVAWPALMLCLLLLVTGLQGRHVFGPGAAALAMAATMLWPVSTEAFFRAGRLDHHNVQIILTTLLMIALIRPGAPAAMGILGGLAAGLSLSVGLETLPLVGLAGIVLTARAVGDMAEDGTRLLAFSGALAVGCLVPFVAQTAPSAWADAHCDQLSPPSLALIGIAVAASLGLVLPARRWSLATGLAIFTAIVTAGIVISAPLLRPCLDGPYAALPDHARALIFDISEVRPAHWFLAHNPLVFFEFVAPALGAVIVASLVWLRRRARGLSGPTENRAVATLLIFAAITTLGTFIQIRIVVLTVSSVPLLTGYALAVLLSDRLAAPTRRNGLALVCGVVVTVMLPTLFHLAGDAGLVRTKPPGPTAQAEGPTTCRVPGKVRSLDRVPAGRILHTIDLGPPILLLTRHQALSATYHRHPDALVNGIIPFVADETGLHAALERTGADYLLICRDSAQSGDGFVAELADGAISAGLIPVSGPDQAFLMFRVE